MRYVVVSYRHLKKKRVFKENILQYIVIYRFESIIIDIVIEYFVYVTALD